MAVFAQDAPLLSAAPKIAWRVENPFRFFRSSVAADLHRRTLADLTHRERASPILNIEKRLGRQFPFGWSEQVYKDSCWNIETSTFATCSRNGSYFRPTQHSIVARLATGRLNNLDCAWLVTPLSGHQRPQIVHASCNRVVKLKIPYPNGAQVSVSAAGRPIAETRVKVRDVFIVSMGDSFASGEGNPDKAVRFSNERRSEYGQLPSGVALDDLPVRKGKWEKVGEKRFHDGGAGWVSQACHRSLYSHHVRTALHLALEDPHRAITFASFACAGAEIETGMFRRFKGSAWTPNPPEHSQISAAAQAQCGNVKLGMRIYPNAYHMKDKVPGLRDVTMMRCPRRRSRPIELIFLSIGGNDIGFSGIVGNAILSDASKLRQIGGWLGAILTSRQADQKLRDLPIRYRALNRALHNILHVPWKQSDRILLTAYPLLATRPDQRSLCPNTKLGLSVFPDFALNTRRAKVSTRIAGQLYRLQARIARNFGWTFVDAHRWRFAGHSICAGSEEIETSIAEDLRIPRYKDGRWHPYAPTQYQPYAPRRRWFRTPNDAYMTANSHLLGTGKLLNFQKLSWFQLLFASTYSGAFHPNAQGQAAMADALATEARAVLAKYRALEADTTRDPAPLFFSDRTAISESSTR